MNESKLWANKGGFNENETVFFEKYQLSEKGGQIR